MPEPIGARRFAPTMSAACCGRGAQGRVPRLSHRTDRPTRHFARSRTAASGRRSRMQEEVGLQSITDGEFRRGSWFAGFVDAVEGLTTRDAPFDFRDSAGGTAKFQTAYVDGKLRRRARDHHAMNSRSSGRMTKRTPKVTLPTPSLRALPARRPDRQPRRLSRPRRVLGRPDRDLSRRSSAISAALGCTLRAARRGAVRDAVRSGSCARSLQDRRQGPRARCSRTYIWAANQVIAEPPGRNDHRACICAAATTRASGWRQAATSRSPRSCSTTSTVDAFFLEYDTERAGGFEPLRLMPGEQDGGARTGQLQDAGAGAGRRAASAASTRPAATLPLERLGISPQCGFASSVGGNPLTIEDERAQARAAWSRWRNRFGVEGRRQSAEARRALVVVVNQQSWDRAALRFSLPSFGRIGQRVGHESGRRSQATT